jgi:type IV pilus assembly protein PilV
MVETLVALVVLAVGMLGIASLFVVSLRSGGSAISRTQAVNLAADLAERIRANRRAGEAYAGAGVDNKCSGAEASICSATALAAHDLYEWRNQIKSTFRDGAASGTVAYAAGASALDPPTYTITVTWKEQSQNASQSSSDQQFRLQVEIPET